MRKDLEALQDTPPWDWPSDTDKTLLSVLNDRGASPEDRLLAAELAGDWVVINDQVADRLLAVLQDGKEGEELRAQAAVSLGPALDGASTAFLAEGEVDADFEEDPDDSPISKRMFHKVARVLKAVYDDARQPKLVRRRVLEASVRATEDWHEKAARDAFSSSDRDWQLTGVFAMQYIKADFDKEIMQALTSSDEDIQFEAVVAAGSREVKAAWPRVVALVNGAKTEKQLRLAAIQAMAEIDYEKAEPRLLELARDADPDIAEVAEEARLMADGAGHDFDDEDWEEDEDESSAGSGNHWVN